MSAAELPGLRHAEVLGTTMAYRERGEGPAVVLLHGNPTSSFLWRDVVAGLPDGVGRLVLVDLIGMGGSAKPDLAYTLVEHVRHVEALLDVLALDPVVLVGHDWGVAIGLALLQRRPERVRGVAVMEGHLRPLAGWESFDDGGQSLFQALRGPEGERLALDENLFLDTLLPLGMHRTLTAEELATYRAPFPDARSRRPLLQWAREIPVAGDPPGATVVMEAAWRHATASPVPKLLVHGTPGVVVGPELVAECRASLPALTVVDVGDTSHFVPEDRPREVAAALAAWLPDVLDL